MPRLLAIVACVGWQGHGRDLSGALGIAHLRARVLAHRPAVAPARACSGWSDRLGTAHKTHDRTVPTRSAGLPAGECRSSSRGPADTGESTCMGRRDRHCRRRTLVCPQRGQGRRVRPILVEVQPRGRGAIRSRPDGTAADYDSERRGRLAGDCDGGRRKRSRLWRLRRRLASAPSGTTEDDAGPRVHFGRWSGWASPAPR